MIALTLAEVGQICSGRLTPAGWADEVTGVQIDSRRVEEGDLFVAVGGGVDFTKHAFARGAAAALVPDDAFADMAALGRAVRGRSSARVVAITGSTGKTSTKDILAALCRPHRRTVAAQASYNAELGVPLTLCRLEKDTEICVLEMAMRGFGQIADLCAIGWPHVGVITNVAPVHLERVGSVEGVARAKAELLHALPADGAAVVPTETPLLEPYLTNPDVRVVRFGPGGDVFLGDAKIDEAGSQLTVMVHDETVMLRLPLTARYQAQNALAAVAAYHALGLPPADVWRGAADIELTRWRGEEIPLPGDGLLINDCYNANPVSMRAALEHQRDRAGTRRRVAVLGEMAELGPDGPVYHREIGRLADELGVAVLVGVGLLAQAYLETATGIGARRWVETTDEAARVLDELLEPGDCVLVKGSRAVGLEAVVEGLTALMV